MTFGLSAKDWSILKELLIDPLKKQNAKVWVFGSRATKTHRKFSDIDVLYESPKELPLGFISQIQETLENSDLPVKVDLVKIDDLAKSYEQTVLAQRIEV